jgi:hypothetical protein
MLKKIIILFVILLTVTGFGSSSIQACSVCGCGDPLQAAGTVHAMAGDIHLGLETLYLTASAQSDDNPTQTESLTQKTLNAVLAFSPTNDLTLVALIPFTQKDWNLSAGDDVPASASPIGFGDISLGLRYFLVVEMDMKNKGSQNFAVSVGTSIPTGNENAVDSNGNRFDQHAQLGTGEWGPYAGLLYTWINNGFTFSANFNALFHTVNPYQYQFGTAFTWGTQAQVHLDDPFAVSLAVEGRFADHDISNGDSQFNTGGTVIDLTPGIGWNPLEDWGLYGKVQIPVLTNLFGTQTVGATVLFGTQLLLR